MWNGKTKVISVITRENGTILKAFRIYPIIIPVKNIRKLQETAILCTAHILRYVQNIQYEK
jgi:hypothetical protein